MNSRKLGKSVQNLNNMSESYLSAENQSPEMNRRALSNLNLNQSAKKKPTDGNAIDNLDFETQQTLLKTFEMFYEQESEVMIATLEESREEIKNSMMELFYEQEHFKEELHKASEGKYTFKRKKENSIPLSEYLRKKKGLGSRNSDSNSPNETVQPIQNGQHPSDKMAVEKYLRKKERQKQAEANRINREHTEISIEAETQKILDKLNEIDLSKEKERERQMEKIQAKLAKGKQHPVAQKDDHLIATEIIENYNDSKLAFERDKKLQQDRFKARLSAARDRSGVTQGGNRNLNDAKYSTSKNVPSVDI